MSKSVVFSFVYFTLDDFYRVQEAFMCSLIRDQYFNYKGEIILLLNTNMYYYFVA